MASFSVIEPGCAAPISRPVGIPETPFWFVVGDSAFWYEPADSLALVQFADGTSETVAEQRLYDLRRVGWRMTPLRGPALQRAGEDQSLSQSLFQVEKVQGARSPVGEWPVFARRFWSKRDAASEPLLGILPGLRNYGQPPTRYYWPNCVSITWGDSLTAAQAESWLSNQKCIVQTSPQLTYQYYVQRIWVVELPAGARLFEWLRKLNGEAVIEAAYPVSSLREPPAPDPRDPGLERLAAGGSARSSRRPENCSETLWQAYRIARFAGFTTHVPRATPAQVEGELFKVLLITAKGTPADDSTLVASYGGRVISLAGARVEAWVPYTVLPVLAEESRVLKLDVASR